MTRKPQIFAIIVAVGMASAFFGMSVLAADPPKFIAPALNVPIPGLDFTKHPIVLTTDGKAKITFLSAYVGAVYKYLLGISVIAAAVMIVYGGFRYVLGSMTGVLEGKNIIKDAIIGLVLIFGSYTILATLNPDSLTELKPLAVQYIQPTPLEISIKFGEGVPNEQLNFAPGPVAPAPAAPASGGQPAPSSPQPTTPAPSSPQPTTPAPSSPSTGGGATFTYQVPASLCGSPEDCKNRFCSNKDATPPPGLPKPSELVGFTEIFPPTMGEQIKEKGLTFSLMTVCFKSKGCLLEPKTLNTITHGPGAKTDQVFRMAGNMIFRAEVRDAFVKAGEEAKKRGYFIGIGDATRTMKDVMIGWCDRIKNNNGSTLGLAVPGTSPHLLGVAADVQLYQLLDGGTRYRPVTVMGVCPGRGQVEEQQSLGIENMRLHESIMASAGFKHLASEVHHYNFGNVYPSDCTTCEFPGEFWKRQQKECKKK